MKALVWTEPGRLEYRARWARPTLSKIDNVQVRVRAVGVCATDVHLVCGVLDFAKPPWILGHEICGVVDQNVSKQGHWRPGDRVIVDPVVGCDHCLMCRTGRKHLCAAGGELGTTKSFGGFGEFVVVPATNLYKMPENMAWEQGVFAEPLNCIVGAVEHVSPWSGRRVLICGAGPAGLLFAQVVKTYGAGWVTIVDASPDRISVARHVGVDESLVGEVNMLPKPLGVFDVTVEAAGSADTVARCFDWVQPGGTVILYGLTGASTATIISDQVVLKDLTVVSSVGAPLRWNRAIALIESGDVDVRSIISHRVDYAEAIKLFRAMTDQRARPIKTVLIPQYDE